ncbi:MAG: hypothetical protein IJW79_07530 [Clostridia bacterium]|nr:hypothetical protein [Clostridia bacterium]
MVTLKVNPKEKHEISPYLYMQFMEPLGVCDSSVDAAWDYAEEKWHQSIIDKVNELAPTMVRWGGCLASYYHWKEAIGKFEDRKPMVNYLWGGLYSNHVGTHEIIDFCRKVNAEPFLVVNMESDGRMHWAYPKEGINRFGTADEAAEWVDYCNNPDNKLRIANGIKAPYNVKYWQIGNETSYCPTGYGSDECVDATKRFAQAMRKVAPSLKLVGWGDKSKTDDTWCKKMSEVEEIDMIAFHHHFGSGLPNSPLRATDYRNDWENTWTHLMNSYKSMEETIARMRADCGNKRLAMTEGHFAIPGRNRNEVLSSWGAGVAYARCHNVIMRNSDVLDIATMADFFGTTWQVNALLIPNNICQNPSSPDLHPKAPYLQPVGAIMSLFGHHQGKYGLNVSYNGAIDAVASKTDNRIFLHIANTDMNASQTLKLDICDKNITSAEMYCIAAKADTEITMDNANCFDVQKSSIEGNTVILPPAAVAAIEITLE